MSGGRATVARIRGDVLARQAGDITAISPEGHALTDLFYFELKFYRNLQIDSFLVKGKGILAKFWHDTVRNAAKYKRNPILVAKQNNMPTLVISNPGTMSHFRRPMLTRYDLDVTTHESISFEVNLLDEVLESTFKERTRMPVKRLKLIRRG